MDVITITKLFSTTSNDGSLVWTYEVVETGERFESFSNETYAAFADHAIQKELEKQLIAFNDAEVDFSESSLALTKSTDCSYVPEEPIPRSARDEEVERHLLQAYSDVLVGDICELVNKNCEACEIFDNSQDHHDCLMLSTEIRVYRYLSEALRTVDEDKVTEFFVKNTERLTPKMNALELLKYQCQDTRSEIVERRREELENILIENMYD